MSSCCHNLSPNQVSSDRYGRPELALLLQAALVATLAARILQFTFMTSRAFVIGLRVKCIAKRKVKELGGTPPLAVRRKPLYLF